MAKVRLFALAVAATQILLAVFAPEPAYAWAAAIFYSAPENGYGWCTRSTLNAARDCAEQSCVAGNNSDCKLVLECSPVGWGAIARTNNKKIKGFGASCGVNDISNARSVALAVCTVAAHNYCWLDYTFTSRKTYNTTNTADKFGLTLYAQSLLNLQGRQAGTADGAIGSKTRAAIKQFQVDLGQQPTGELDNDLFYRFSDSVGGAAAFARLLDSKQVEPNKDLIANLSSAAAPVPDANKPVADALDDLSQSRRLMRLATILAANGYKCSLPALSAKRGTEEDDEWEVKCKEDDYVVLFHKDGWEMGFIRGKTYYIRPGDNPPPKNHS